MLEIVGAGFGLVSRLLPEILKLFTQQRDQKHELEMTKLQLQIDEKRSQLRIDEVHAGAAAAQGTAEMQGWIDAIVGQGKVTGIGWIDAMSQSVRPILTYWWCVILYTSDKVVTIAVGITETLPIQQLAPMVITEFDRMVISSILSFWFVDRTLRKRGI